MGIKIILSGIIIETVGLALDILHHLNIGIKTAEGLLTFNHFLIFVGFVINVAGVLIFLFRNENN